MDLRVSMFSGSVIHSAKAARRTPSSQESQISGAPAARARVEFSVALFPRTPALSPGEREDDRPSVGESGAVSNFSALTLRFPLPARCDGATARREGEGQGEGALPAELVL